MATRHNLHIPPTVLRLGLVPVENLVTIGLKRAVKISDVDSIVNKIYPERRKATRALLRIVSDVDLQELNSQLSVIRSSGIDTGKCRLMTSYARGICTIMC